MSGGFPPPWTCCRAAGVAATGAPYVSPPAANWVQESYDNLRARPSSRQDVDWLGSGNLAVSRAPFERLGGFDRSLEACEDVDLCNRLRLAGHRIVADPALRSVHFGDPSTLRALFFGELWRGRDNARVTWRGPRTLRHLRSMLIPIATLTRRRVWCGCACGQSSRARARRVLCRPAPGGRQGLAHDPAPPPDDRPRGAGVHRRRHVRSGAGVRPGGARQPSRAPGRMTDYVTTYSHS